MSGEILTIPRVHSVFPLNVLVFWIPYVTVRVS